MQMKAKIQITVWEVIAFCRLGDTGCFAGHKLVPVLLTAFTTPERSILVTTYILADVLVSTYGRSPDEDRLALKPFMSKARNWKTLKAISFKQFRLSKNLLIGLYF